MSFLSVLYKRKLWLLTYIYFELLKDVNKNPLNTSSHTRLVLDRDAYE